MTEDMPDRMPEGMPDRMPDKMSDRMSEDMPDKVPEDMPDRMPEDMPDRKPDKMSEIMPGSLWMGIRPKVKLKLHFRLNPIMLAPPSLISQPHAFSPLEHLHQFHRGGSKPPRPKKKYFTSCDPHHDISTFCYWQFFWHSI